jgi:glycerol kinase
MKKYILTIDQGTTSTRAILFDKNGRKVCVKQMEFTQITPKSGWVLHNPDEIYLTVLQVIKACINDSRIDVNDIDSIGITNQRETVVVWDKETLEAIYPAIVWQSRQSEGICNDLINSGYTDMIHEKTGLFINPYFSASKIKWILDNYDKDHALRNSNRLLCGTIDTYLLYRLTKGVSFKTDYTNASRTMLFNINTLTWDNELLDLFGINLNMLPEVMDSSSLFGHFEYDGIYIPITAMIGDQQSSLFGHIAFNKGSTKVTYGTGCFMLMNTKDEKIFSKNGLLTTIAYKIGDEVCYALEGSVFVAGSAVQWLRDGLKLISNSAQSEEAATLVSDTMGVYFVPAFVGMGTPYWDNASRGAIFGLSRGTTKEHLIRATLEGIAYEALDVLEVMEKEAKVKIPEISVDGGAAINNFLIQFESDITLRRLVRPRELETTALGACYLAGLYTKFFSSIKEIEKLHEVDKLFMPTMEKEKRDYLVEGWKIAVNATRMFKR